jgi:hypothetical protein
LGQWRREATVSGADFHNDVIRIEIRRVRDSLKHAGIDHKMLPQPLFGADLKVSKLLAKGVQNSKKRFTAENAENAEKN